jgi:hypothetical protein
MPVKFNPYWTVMPNQIKDYKKYIVSDYSGCHKYVPFVIFVNKHKSSL